MSEQLSPTQISLWFRERAKLFNKIADTVDDTFRSAPAAALNGAPEEHPTFPGIATVTKEDVRKIVSTKAMRVGDLASEFKVERKEIEDIVADKELFIRGKMGWISLK